MSIATAPPLDAEINFPALATLLQTISNPATENKEEVVENCVKSRNADCFFCEKPVLTVTTDPVVLLRCGHAYHTTCGRSFLSKKTGTECPQKACHLTSNDIERDMVSTILEECIARGEFKKSDLKDPILSRSVRERVFTCYKQILENRDVSRPLAVGSIGELALTPSEVIVAQERRKESAYEERWLDSRNGKDTLSKIPRMKLLAPFISTGALSVISILKEKDNLDYGRLLELETESRKIAAGDSEEESAEISAHSMKDRISFSRFEGAKLSLSDIYFGLKLKSFSTLKDIGFKAEHITNSSGDYPLVELVDLYGLNAELLRKNIKFGMDEILAGNFSAQELHEAGFDFESMYCKLGMTREDFLRLPFTPKEWHDTLKLDKKYLTNPLQIGQGELDLLRWNKEDMRQAFDLLPQEELLINPYPTKPTEPAVTFSAPQTTLPNGVPIFSLESGRSLHI